MAKLTTKQLTDLFSKLTNQSVELVENDTDSDYNEDTLLSAVDGTRTPIIRQLLKTEIHGEASRKVNDAYRKSISSKFGVPLADLNGLESDAILEKAIEHYRLNTTDTEKSQQKKIDDLTEGNKKLIERAARVFKQNEELFEIWSRLWDADLPTDKDKEEGTSRFKHYHHLRHEVRMQMGEAGYCMRCYNFVCECEDQYD